MVTVPSATSRTNEAAERLREWISGIANDSRAVPNRWLDAALSEERRLALPSVDELAQIIRRVDGDHSLGAGELAERILDEIGGTR